MLNAIRIILTKLLCQLCRSLWLLSLLFAIGAGTFGFSAAALAQTSTVWVDSFDLEVIETDIKNGCKKLGEFPQATADPSIVTALYRRDPISPKHYNELKAKWNKLPRCKKTTEESLFPPTTQDVQTVSGDLGLDIGVAGGVTTGHRDGSLGFIDVFSGEPASIGQSGSSTFGTFGVLGTLSMPIFLPGLPGSRGFFETGFLFHTDNHATANFVNFSGNEATGQTATQTLWSVPLLAGVQIPVSDFGIPAPNVALQLKGGGMIDRRKVTFSTFEVTPDFRTEALFEETQVNPAFGFGFIYAPPPSVSPFKFGVQTIFDFQQPINVSVQSMPFPSAFYNVNTGRQLNTTVLLLLQLHPTWSIEEVRALARNGGGR